MRNSLYSGNNVTLTLALIFRSPFAGARQSFAKVIDAGGLQLGFQTTGSWTVPAGNLTPVSLYANPAIGFGRHQTRQIGLAQTFMTSAQ